MRAARGAAVDFQNTEEFRNTAILGGVTGISDSFAKASGAAIDYKILLIQQQMVLVMLQ